MSSKENLYIYIIPGDMIKHQFNLNEFIWKCQGLHLMHIEYPLQEPIQNKQNIVPIILSEIIFILFFYLWFRINQYRALD